MIQGSREKRCLFKGDGIYFCPELHAEPLFVQLYKRITQHVIYNCSSTRMLVCLKARSGQSFIASSACKYTNILLLFHLINLNLGKLGHQKRIHFL